MTLDRSMDNNSVSSDSTQGDDSQQEVRTLFVSGLPMDTKPREIYLMFRSYSGYQGSLLKLTGKEGKKATPVAFVTFENREQAEVCKAELQGIRFDPELPTSIRIEFAKANTKVTKPVLIRPPSISGTTIIPGPGFPGFELTPGIFTPDMQWAQNTNFVDINGNHTALQHLHPGITTLPLVHSPLLLSSTVNMPSHSPLIGNPMLGLDHQVCTTLFVANLGYNTTEDELKNMFGRIPSFRRLKMLRNKGTTPVSFVEYSDVIGALHAKNIFHGAVLLTSENGGIRIEFARNKMGESGKKNDLSYDIQVQG